MAIAFIIMLQVITQPLYAKVKEVFLLINSNIGKYPRLPHVAAMLEYVRARRRLRPRVFSELSLSS